MQNKSLNYDFALAKIANEMQQKLATPKGKAKYGERMAESEPVFADMKQNQGFVSFLCRGKNMALTELGLVCIAHNLTKIFQHIKFNPQLAMAN